MSKKIGNDKVKMGGAIALGSLAVFGVGMLAGTEAYPQIEYVEINNTETIMINNTETIIQEVPVVEYVINETIKEVDNGDLNEVLEFIHDEDGDVGYLTNGLFDDEVNEIVDRVILVNEFKDRTENIVKSSFVRELERQEGFDKRDVKGIRVDSDDITVNSVDFSDLNAELEAIVEFRYDGDLYEAIVKSEFFDNDALVIEIQSVTLQ